VEISLDGQLPSAPEAERAVAEILWLDQSTYNDIAGKLRPEHFGNGGYRDLYRLIQERIEAGEPIDSWSLREAAKKQNIFGLSFIIEDLGMGAPDITRIGYYAEKVIEAAKARSMVTPLQRALQRLGSDPTSDVARDLLDDLMPASVGSEANHIHYAPQLVDEAMDDIDYRRETGDFITGIPTGIGALDDYLSGWQRGILTLFGGYTSHGKTAIGLDMMLKLLMAYGNESIHAFYFALEMTRKMLTFRVLANQSRQNLYFVRSGNLSEPGYEALTAAGKRLKSFGQRFGMSDGIFSLRDIVTTARNLRRQSRLDILFVDYLQLVETEYEESRQREVDLIGKGLLRLAKELDIPVIAFAQLNEGALNRPGHRPMLSDMRESRALNQHARTVMLLNRPWMWEKEDPDLRPCQAEIFIEKNSEGKLGVIGTPDMPLHFDVTTQYISEEPCGPGCRYHKEEDVRETVLNRAEDQSGTRSPYREDDTQQFEFEEF
jgi:replicative DNA helicase